MESMRHFRFLLSVFIISCLIQRYQCASSTADLTSAGTSTPDPTTQNTSTPDSTTQHTSTPDPTTQNTSTPDPTTQHTSTPDPTTENTSTPDPTTQHTSTPDPTTQNASTPDPTTLNTSTPDPTTQHISTSDPTTPDISTSDPTTSRGLEDTSSTASSQTLSTEKSTTPDYSTTQNLPWTHSPRTLPGTSDGLTVTTPSTGEPGDMSSSSDMTTADVTAMTSIDLSTTSKIPPCSDGNFGDGCKFVCMCKDSSEVCDKRSGYCSSGCPPGFHGPGCNLAKSGEEPVIVMLGILFTMTLLFALALLAILVRIKRDQAYTSTAENYAYEFPEMTSAENMVYETMK